MSKPFKIGVISVFPEMFSAMTVFGVSSRALEQNIYSMDYWNPRDFTEDVHRTIDDRPYGGGPGMVMMAEPLFQSLNVAKQSMPEAKVVAMSPQGLRLDQALTTELVQQTELIILCGRYEGIDERLMDSVVDYEVSIGDYVLSGGELAAMVLIDTMVRTLPGALGNDDSANEDSFQAGLLDYPHYTRPESWQNESVPEVLLSGNHEKIKRWRLKQALGRTWLRRPDLLEGRELSSEEQVLLDEFKQEIK